MVAGGKIPHQNEPDKQAPIDPKKAVESDERWDEVSEASWESFPASDPPAFTMRQPSKPPKKPSENH